MRRKSERSKEKEKSSPEKKFEKTPRRSRRQSRKRKSSVSASSDKEESGTEENETVIRSSQEDTEEEQVVNLEETSSQVGAVITVDVTNTPEEEESVAVSTRSRKSTKKHAAEQPPLNENVGQLAVPKGESSHDNEWKEDNQFWEETDFKIETSDTKHKEKEGRSSVWKVKSSDGKGGEIQKLKLCIVRPQETAESVGRKKQRTDMSDTGQCKEKSDIQDDSSKDSQEMGEEEKLSSTENTASKMETCTQADLQLRSDENLCSSDSPGEKIPQINISQTDSVAEELNADTSEIENTAGENNEIDNKGDITENTGFRKELNKNEEGSKKADLEEIREAASTLDNFPAVSVVVDDSSVIDNSSSVDGNIASAECLHPRKPAEADETCSSPKEVQCPIESDVVKQNDSTEHSGKCLDEIPVPEIESNPHKSFTSENREASISMNVSANNDCLDGKEIGSKSMECVDNIIISEKNLETEHVESSSDIILKKVGESESSDAEKDSQRNDDSKDSSPIFRERCVENERNEEQQVITDELRKTKVQNLIVNKHKDHKSRSPHRREKISLRRSFSGKGIELEQNINENLLMNKSEKSVDIDKIPQDNKANDSEKMESDTVSSILPSIPRKRRWGQSNSWRPSKKPVLSISTDSLKCLIPGAKPVTIAEVQLAQDDDTRRENELWENEKPMEQERLKNDLKGNDVLEKVPLHLPEASRISVAVTDNLHNKVVTRKISIVSDDARTLQRSPSPARHKATNVLFITNLVRPFTVNQLKELLARTGKIVEGGFWIDKIKSKCYVEYEKDSEAKETRHALHGVRWPVSNPKTLCVDFGKKEEMEMAQAVAESDEIPRKTEPLKVERNIEWVVEQMREKERERDVREREKEKERDHEKERTRVKERPQYASSEVMDTDKKITIREWDLGKIGQTSPPERDARYDDRNRDKERKRREKTHRSRSVSPHDTLVRKSRKKEEDAPAKLLDDLFRKTKTTPCIYWLPLTAEQIVVKEEMRRKHVAEHERRMAELRKAERERERVRAQQRQQRRANEREKRRRRSGSGSPKK